ncbi:MAG: DciA family protein [Patescibacteria group bacterium]|nr:DciA family protein [Patescibacteria group bacterium]
MSMAWKSLKSLLNKSLQTAGIEEQINAQRVLDTADKLLKQRWGEEMGGMMIFKSFASGTLQAVSTSPGAMQTLKAERIDFMNAINYQLGKRVVYKINIRLQGY